MPRLLELMRAAETAARWSEAQLSDMIGAAGPRIILVMEKGSEIAGFAVAQVITSQSDINQNPGEPAAEGEIENIVVDARWQRRGLGRVLLEKLLERIQHAGCREVFLEVRESNAAARGLYAKLGFVEVGRRVKYYVQPQEDAVVYRFRAG